ncbi:hypothetical protein C8J56DRAFT_367262 [Mycena floridula]|nr:hypothetical protein C8J56DRAFT_367262 [Mycena floridula]
MSTSASTASTTTIAQDAPAGALLFTQPPATATSYYKIAQNQQITFGWTTTNVLVAPTSLTVSAVCANKNTYPVGIVPATQTNVVWDVYAYQTSGPGLENPLVQGTCTLQIWDERGPDATRQPGFLALNTGLTFAMYTPQGYTPLADGWTCSSCNSATGIAFHPAAYSAVVVTLVMFLSGFRLLTRAFRH